MTRPRPQTGTARKLSKAEHRRRTADTRPLLTVAEVAARLDCSKWTVYRLISDGRIPATRVLGPKSLRVRPDDLDDFINAITYG